MNACEYEGSFPNLASTGELESKVFKTKPGTQHSTHFAHIHTHSSFLCLHAILSGTTSVLFPLTPRSILFPTRGTEELTELVKHYLPLIGLNVCYFTFTDKNGEVSEKMYFSCCWWW